VILENNPPAAVGADFIRDPSSRFTVSATLDRDGYIVLSDTYYPGWRVYVDGEPRPLMRADYLFRAVAVPAGTHEVTFEYAPLSVTVGLALSAIAVLIWVGLFVYHRRARRER
ncbi:MAG: YfhO family protein, partial [Chloroflexota bacterium]